jgi:hypothetical protein
MRAASAGAHAGAPLSPARPLAGSASSSSRSHGASVHASSGSASDCWAGSRRTVNTRSCRAARRRAARARASVRDQRHAAAGRCLLAVVPLDRQDQSRAGGRLGGVSSVGAASFAMPDAACARSAGCTRAARARPPAAGHARRPPRPRTAEADRPGRWRRRTGRASGRFGDRTPHLAPVLPEAWAKALGLSPAPAAGRRETPIRPLVARSARPDAARPRSRTAALTPTPACGRKACPMTAGASQPPPPAEARAAVRSMRSQAGWSRGSVSESASVAPCCRVGSDRSAGARLLRGVHSFASGPVIRSHAGEGSVPPAGPGESTHGATGERQAATGNRPRTRRRRAHPSSAPQLVQACDTAPLRTRRRWSGRAPSREHPLLRVSRRVLRPPRASARRGAARGSRRRPRPGRIADRRRSGGQRFSRSGP